MIKDVILSPDGQRLAAVNWAPSDRKLVVWDVLSGQEVRSLAVPDTASLAFSTDGARLFFGGADGVIRTLDLSP